MPTKPTIQDQTFLFTGTLTEFTRDEAEALVEANGGKVLSGVTAKLNYLVVGEDAGSKLAKAKAPLPSRQKRTSAIKSSWTEYNYLGDSLKCDRELLQLALDNNDNNFSNDTP